jgi:hypothetical protein
MQVAIGLYPGYTALDVFGPYQVFAETPGTEVVVCAEQTGHVDRKRFHIDVERTFADVPRPDMLVVPGGSSPRSRVRARPRPTAAPSSTGSAPRTSTPPSLPPYAPGRSCSGRPDCSTASGPPPTGPATTSCAKYGAEPTEQRVVFQDRIVTGAGISAGIDLALAILAKLLGPEMAQAVQLAIEYDPQPPFDSGAPSKAPAAIRELVLAAGFGRREQPI